MIPVVMFDFLSDVPYLEDLFEESELDASKNNIREQVVDLGYETHNPMLNLKTLTALQIYYLVRLVTLFGILYQLKTRCKKNSNIYLCVSNNN
jgi:hypothetical protein